MIASIIELIISPIGRLVSLVLLVLAVLGGIYGKGRYDDHKAFKEKIQVESTKAVKRADVARAAATDRFNAGGLRNDGFRRD
jgi:hypothetical protein